ncbi:YegP family protein [Haloplanus aerogenes]|uniref:DUF1508 domain-containing protein n=1 Tax=Haloplanus aerogenes TaxID=660522 RepID=A0A3M0D9M8_9EURY|nr:YegP family protein [Haloplanus aerogenes]AZH26391.1 DUF1508 domain-containing protein [Haloplanus aerogenes]RMB18144.1 uncharacterized protein YegP (UPF0339 family) [Haloplanus aerogenes]
MTTETTFRVIETGDETFQWHLRADDGSTLATSDGVYETKQAAMRDIQRLKRVAPDAGVESVDTGTP